MTKKELKKELALIQQGIRNFPKVLAQKEKAFKHKQKMMKAFASVSQSLLKMEKIKK